MGSELAKTLWNDQDKIDNGIFSLNLSTANGSDVVNVTITWIYSYCIYCIQFFYVS